jgi:ribosome biogenesis GTPase
MKGRVIKSTGSWYAVKTEEGEVLRSRLRGKFKQKGLKINNPIAVGDWVILEKEQKGDNTAVISEIVPRENYIIRQSTRKSAFSHILASNLDQTVLVATLAFPRTSLGFIDRFLVSAESFRIPSIILFNKADILEEDGFAYAAELQELYESLGYKTAFISVLEDENLDPILEMMKGKTSLISGHSGVGKSSLLNKLIPGLELKTGEVSTFANKGTHTTTFAELFEIDEHSSVIDTPGIKELGLVDMEPSEISHYFPEMRELIGACKFHNCSHTKEPGCAVQAAYQEGLIAASRYASYFSMMEDYDNRR